MKTFQKETKHKDYKQKGGTKLKKKNLKNKKER